MNASMIYYKERIFNEMSTIYSTKEQRDCQLLIYLFELFNHKHF